MLCCFVSGCDSSSSSGMEGRERGRGWRCRKSREEFMVVV